MKRIIVIAVYYENENKDEDEDGQAPTLKQGDFINYCAIFEQPLKSRNK